MCLDSLYPQTTTAIKMKSLSPFLTFQWSFYFGKTSLQILQRQSRGCSCIVYITTIQHWWMLLLPSVKPQLPISSTCWLLGLDSIVLALEEAEAEDSEVQGMESPCKCVYGDRTSQRSCWDPLYGPGPSPEPHIASDSIQFTISASSEPVG